MIVIESKETQINTVLNEIKYLRGMQGFLIDRRNQNRYTVVVKEDVGYTAYCFSTPIYNDSSKKLIHLGFEKTKMGYIFDGSNARMTICQNRCVLERKDGAAVITLDKSPAILGFDVAPTSNVTAIPSLNGLKFIVKGNSLRFSLKHTSRQEYIRFNPSCFTVMREAFNPFLSISALYAEDRNGTFSPVEIKYAHQGNQNYEIQLSHDIPNGQFLFEVNLYEQKLFQDTTVESIHPDDNNVYGAVGFIGKTKLHGEQWLYSRPDFSKIPNLTSRVDKVLLHIPILNGSLENIDVYIPQKRFCSFGSTWNKRVEMSNKVTSSYNDGKYITVDVTSMFTEKSNRVLTYNEGLILKKPKGKNNSIVISTGDCYSAPQILEVKFK